MKNIQKVSRQNLKKVQGGIAPKCCSYYPPAWQHCCPTPSNMSCPPPWVDGSFPC
ncbi:bacteriocin-like protein [Chryseobacterium sp. SIMBA_028]|uniref:bacteriocin-like protein n=1 Tax=Chryseobacterium sp. SIMBA_028 TaxID=3085771 RepID=UPI00397C4814